MSEPDPRSIKRIIVQVQPAGEKDFINLVWRKLKVRASLDEICHYMELELPSSERGKIHKHDKVEVRYYNKYITDSSSRRRVTTIMVDELTDVTEANRKAILVVGRSPARDIIDSAYSGIMAQTTLTKKAADQAVMVQAMNFEDLVRSIAGEFGIKAYRFPDAAPVTGPVHEFDWTNESPWGKFLNKADEQGLIFTSNEAGDIQILRGATLVGKKDSEYEGFQLAEKINIRSIEATENGAEQFHTYIGRAPGQEAVLTDPTCKNNRILVFNITDETISPIDLERRVNTEMLRRQERRIVATVSGWGLTDTQIQSLGNTNKKEVFWKPNYLIPVNIPSRGISGNLLISQVEYQADESAMTAALTLVNPEVYQ
jgi:prophage tail gpP-like protein